MTWDDQKQPFDFWPGIKISRDPKFIETLFTNLRIALVFDCTIAWLDNNLPEKNVSSWLSDLDLISAQGCGVDGFLSDLDSDFDSDTPEFTSNTTPTLGRYQLKLASETLNYQYDALIGDGRAGEEAPSFEGGVHVRTCRCTPPQTCVKHLSNGSLVTHKIWTQSAQPFARYGRGVCTCARADALHLRHV